MFSKTKGLVKSYVRHLFFGDFRQASRELRRLKRRYRLFIFLPAAAGVILYHAVREYAALCRMGEKASSK